MGTQSSVSAPGSHTGSFRKNPELSLSSRTTDAVIATAVVFPFPLLRWCLHLSSSYESQLRPLFQCDYLTISLRTLPAVLIQIT